MELDLTELRKQIDEIDGQLVPLFCRRMDVSRQVSEYKFKAHLPVLNEKREDEILARVYDEAGAYGDAARLLFSCIMDASRALQHQLMGGGAGLRMQINDAKKVALKVRPKLACQGVPGAYSGMAGKSLFPDSDIAFYEKFEDVFIAVEQDKADYGIIPIENSSAGSVHESYDLMMKYRLYISSAVELPVRHKILAKKGAKLSDIKTVYSHSQALSQCSEYISSKGLVAIPYYNTAAAAEMVASGSDETVAAIGSSLAAKIYDLDVLDDNIAKSSRNSTRFIAISKNMTITPDADKISLIFAIPHTTGSLYRTLARFAMCGLNLTKIESRPIENSNFKYRFYLDFSGNVSHAETVNLLCALYDELPQFSFLGNYRESRPEN